MCFLLLKIIVFQSFSVTLFFIDKYVCVCVCIYRKLPAFKGVKINYRLLRDKLNSKFPSVQLLKYSLKQCSDNDICPYYIADTKLLIVPCLSAISILFVVNQVV